MQPDERSAIQSCGVFKALSPVEVQDVMGMAARLEFPRGHVVFDQGAEPDGMYVIAQGAVRIVQRDADGAERELAVLAPGEEFGEMALLLDDRRGASAIAASDAVLLRLDRDGFVELLESQDRVASKVLLELARIVSRRLLALERRGGSA